LGGENTAKQAEDERDGTGFGRVHGCRLLIVVVKWFT